MEQLQLSLFEDENPLKEIADEIIKQVNENCKMYDTHYDKCETAYEVWEHVKHLGKRLSVSFYFSNGELHDKETWFNGIGTRLNLDHEKFKELEDKYKVEITIYAEWQFIHLYTIERKYL